MRAHAFLFGCLACIILSAIVLCSTHPWTQTLIWPLLLCALALAGGIGALVNLSALQKGQTELKDLIAATLSEKNPDNTVLQRHGPLGVSIGELIAEMRHQKGLVKGILNGLPMPFLLVDTKERTRLTNKATMEMLEIDQPPESQHGRTLSEVFYNDSTRKSVVGKAMETGEVFSNKEVTITGHKGGEHHVLYNVYPLYDLEKTCIGGICIYLDMTQLKEKEEEICKQNELIGSAADRATGVAENLASASTQLSSQVDDIRALADSQRSRTGEVARAIQQMSASILEVADNARSVTETADTSRKEAAQGAEEVERTRSVIMTVRDSAEELMRDMSQLGEHAERIGDVLNVISDIADQTNLLALNAAIEAARAGEAGRGFAVVADEVRKLAEKTMQATKEVGSVIQAIQSSVEKSRASSETSVSSVMQGVESATAAGEKIKEILSFIEQTNARVHDIADAVMQQSQVSDEVASATTDIQNSAAETAAAMEESTYAVNELAEMAGELKTIIGDMQKSSKLECA